jgi:CheY-like chemotaxis protein
MTEPSPEEPVHILLVEDNPGDVRLTKEAFNSIDDDVEFHVVADGESAVTYVQQYLSNGGDSPPEIILLDLNLPRIDGFGVLDFLNEEFEAAPPPVLILSSSEAEADIEKSYSKGCNAYLTKPDDIGEYASMAQAIKGFWLDAARTPVSPA